MQCALLFLLPALVLHVLTNVAYNQQPKIAAADGLCALTSVKNGIVRQTISK